MPRAFGHDKVTDQKRLARGEHWLYARTRLRALSVRHNLQWKIMIVAGGHPAGEIACIRELMPLAQITAVDRDVACLETAKLAGADHVVQVDDLTLSRHRRAALKASETRKNVRHLRLASRNSAAPDVLNFETEQL